MENIEVEIRSFISQDQYHILEKFFIKNSEFIEESNQETVYLDCEQDLRIQKNDFYGKIWMKKGNIHDLAREELEIKFDKKDYDQMKKLFSTLGYQPQIKWLRKRKQFLWDNLTVCLDYTKGYGYILEIEKICHSTQKEKEFQNILNKFNYLKIEITPKKVFDEKFDYYKNNWKRLLDI